jgi:ABC-type bacteriocin/lantibiotic exporter with double-glycine peptidase domain
VIDGQDIREIGLNAVRGQLALVPQDGTLFLGTLRENMCVISLFDGLKIVLIPRCIVTH